MRHDVIIAGGGIEAVWVPQAGIVDYGTVARKYADLKNHACTMFVMHPARRLPHHWR